MCAKRILIADDDRTICDLLALTLESHGYETFTARNGYQLIHVAQAVIPDLLIVDLMMPQLDGYEAIRQLRNDTRTSHIPMLILTAKSTSDDVVIGFESGADDYITKPFNISELLARIKGHLRRAAQRPVHNPLTGLSGNVLLTEELKYCIKRNKPFALLYIDLDNFKAFNDTYGFARGDRMIRFLADTLIESLEIHQRKTDFIGHIGGDDFAIITTPDILHPLCATIITLFDERVVQFYDTVDLEHGYLTGVDRHGIQRQFPITSISIGVVTNRHRTFVDHEEVSRIATEMKQFAKTKPGSIYEIDERGTRPVPVMEERRGSQLQTVLLISTDKDFSERLSDAFQIRGYRVLLAPGVIEAHALLAHEEMPPGLVAAEAHIGDALHDFYTDMHYTTPELPLVVFIRTPEDQNQDIIHKATMCLYQPFAEDEIVEAIAELLAHSEV